MTWTKITDGFWSDPDVVAIGDAAAGLFVRMIAFANDKGTDGLISRASVHMIAPNRAHRSRAIRALLDATFLLRDGDGYRIRSFHRYNPTSAKVKEKREQDAARKRGDALDSPHGIHAEKKRPDPDPDPDPMKERGALENLPDSIETAAELERIGYARYGGLGGRSVAAVSRLLPIYRHEFEAAAATRGKSWSYFARVVESYREEAAKPKARKGVQPLTRDEEIRRLADGLPD